MRPAAVRTPRAPRRRHLNPAKLKLSKWTTTAPRRREKHFLVTRVVQPDPPDAPIESVEIEAVISKRSSIIRWRELTDPTQWLQGWV